MKNRQLLLPFIRGVDDRSGVGHFRPYKGAHLDKIERRNTLQKMIANREVTTRREAASLLNVNKSTINQYLRELKLYLPGRLPKQVVLKIRPENPRVPMLRVLLEQRQVHTLEEAGKIIGVTRERVRQLIIEHNLPRPHKKPTTRKCKECPIMISIQGKTGLCNACKRSGRYHPTKKFCVHGHSNTPENRYVSNKRDRNCKSYRCKACSKIKMKAWLAKRQARIESGELVLKPSSEFCIHGHKFELDPSFAKNGHVRCAECQRIYYEKRKGNKITSHGEIYQIIQEDQLIPKGG